MPKKPRNRVTSKQEGHEERPLWSEAVGECSTSCCGVGTHHLSFIKIQVLVQLSTTPASLPIITVVVMSYLVNKDVVEVIGQTTCKFVSEV